MAIRAPAQCAGERRQSRAQRSRHRRGPARARWASSCAATTKAASSSTTSSRRCTNPFGAATPMRRSTGWSACWMAAWTRAISRRLIRMASGTSAWPTRARCASRSTPPRPSSAWEPRRVSLRWPRRGLPGGRAQVQRRLQGPWRRQGPGGPGRHPRGAHACLRNAPTRPMKDLGYGEVYTATRMTNPAPLRPARATIARGRRGCAWYEPVPRGLEIRIGDKLCRTAPSQRRGLPGLEPGASASTDRGPWRCGIPTHQAMQTPLGEFLRACLLGQAFFLLDRAMSA